MTALRTRPQASEGVRPNTIQCETGDTIKFNMMELRRERFEGGETDALVF